MSAILGAPSPCSPVTPHANIVLAPLSFPSDHEPFFDHVNFYMNPPFSSPYHQHTSLHHAQSPSRQHYGTKRSAPDDDYDSPANNNISNQFKKLRLTSNIIAGNSFATAAKPNSPTTNTQSSTSTAITASQSRRNGASPDQYMQGSDHDHTPSLPSTDFMPLDETPHRIYIHDLDSEIAAIEAAEFAALALAAPVTSSDSSTSISLRPEIERDVSRIPLSVLQHGSLASKHACDGGGDGIGSHSQALVLYRDPTSISVPPEEDSVRRAIIEARREMRARMRREHADELGFDRAAHGSGSVSENTHGVPLGDRTSDIDSGYGQDEDAMDIG